MQRYRVLGQCHLANESDRLTKTSTLLGRYPAEEVILPELRRMPVQEIAPRPFAALRPQVQSRGLEDAFDGVA